MQFDEFSVALLIQRPDAPVLDADASRALQDAHLAHLADLHAAGKLVAAGPLEDEHYRGLSILNVGVEEARTLKESDPAVRAGRFSVQVMRWRLPSGALHFTPTRFPRSTAEALAR
ncbi:MAG: hypothetical protein JO057_28535 [Chloroflexi bacterium]|nr:hypothetical protein [Chloroflexota bacterium]